MTLERCQLARVEVAARPWTRRENAVDPNLVGVWQNQSDDKEYCTFQADGTLRWFYQGVPVMDLPNSIVEYAYRVDPTKQPAHLDLIGPGIWKTQYFIYEVAGDELRIGGSDDAFVVANRAKDFASKVKSHKRV